MKRKGQHGKFHITKVIGEALWCIFPKIKKKVKVGFICTYGGCLSFKEKQMRYIIQTIEFHANYNFIVRLAYGGGESYDQIDDELY